MSQYRRPHPEPGTVPASNARICADCGRNVSAGDRYCSSCGVAFAGALPRVDPVDYVRPLPGFQYHLVQGLGWGLGFALASAIVLLSLSMLAALALHGLR
jgi:hypothetical protein